MQHHHKASQTTTPDKQDDTLRQYVSVLLHKHWHTEILQAAYDLFTQRGYASVSIVEIAERAGVPPATLYRFFSSKVAIVACLLGDTFLKLQAAADADINLALEEAVQRHFSRLAHFIMVERSLFEAFICGAFESSLLHSSGASRYTRPLSEPLATILRSNAPRAESYDPTRLEETADLITNAFLLRILHGADPEATACTITHLLLYGICS